MINLLLNKLFHLFRCYLFNLNYLHKYSYLDLNKYLVGKLRESTSIESMAFNEL